MRVFAPDSRWSYTLAAIPMLTDLAESGSLPHSPREWISELVAGILIAVLVARLRKGHLMLLAQARTDSLTGLSNRRSFDESVESECARARRLPQPLALVYLDLDHFKQVNDLDGHHEGDRILKQVAAAVTDVVRAHVDQGFRLGGDEFALLLPGSTARQAQRVVDRIRERCGQSSPIWAVRSLRISAGVVDYTPDEQSEEFLRRADRAMYEDKSSAR